MTATARVDIREVAFFLRPWRRRGSSELFLSQKLPLLLISRRKAVDGFDQNVWGFILVRRFAHPGAISKHREHSDVEFAVALSERGELEVTMSQRSISQR